MFRITAFLIVSLCLVSCINGGADKTPDTATSSPRFTNPGNDNGKRLAIMMCGGCHLNEKNQAFSGKRIRDLPRYVGRVFAPNLTRGSARISGYQPEELRSLIRHGQQRDGKRSRFMGTPMISDSDLDDIINFFWSDDPLLYHHEQEQPDSRFSFLAKIYFWFNPPQELNSSSLQNNDLSDTINNGEYLVSILECYACHSKSISKVDRAEPSRTPGYLAGGARLVSTHGTVIRAANLTHDQETGIGQWSEDDFKRALTQGYRPDGLRLRPPMPLYQHLDDREIHSIYSYLRSLETVPNKIDRRF